MMLIKLDELNFLSALNAIFLVIFAYFLNFSICFFCRPSISFHSEKVHKERYIIIMMSIQNHVSMLITYELSGDHYSTMFVDKWKDFRSCFVFPMQRLEKELSPKSFGK